MLPWWGYFIIILWVGGLYLLHRMNKRNRAELFRSINREQRQQSAEEVRQRQAYVNAVLSLRESYKIKSI